MRDIHVFVHEGRDRHSALSLILRVILLSEPLQQSVNVVHTGIGIKAALAAVIIGRRPAAVPVVKLVILVAGILHVTVRLRHPVVPVYGELHPFVVVDAAFFRGGNGGRQEIVVAEQTDVVYALAERGLHAPRQLRHEAAVDKDELTVVMGVQLIDVGRTEDHVALVTGTLLLLVGHLHHDLIDTLQRDVVCVVGVAQRAVIVGVAVGIAQMDDERHVGIDRMAGGIRLR